jgi:hypothetical protein
VPRLDCEWFECDDDELDDSARRFAAVLRRRAADWCTTPCHTLIYPPDAQGPTIAYLDLSATDRNFVLLTVGVHLFDGRIAADQVHNQSFTLPDTPTALSMHADGEPETLGEQAASWFDSILRRPVVRYVWEHAGRTYAERYQFTDGYTLSQRYDRRLAPRGQPEQLISAGHVFGKGWIQTTGLGAPSRIEPQPRRS